MITTTSRLNLLERLINFVAPHNCLGCSAEGRLLCEWCQAEALLPLPPSCYSCQKQTDNYATCASCKRHSRLGHVWVTSIYGGMSQKLVHHLKFERVQDVAVIIAGFLDDTLPYLPSHTIITHVPTASSRRRQRGYDQAELIARNLATRRGLKFQTLLARSGQSRQVGANRRQRHEQLKQAFRSVKSATTAKITNVLLIDDIVTTGATLEAAAQTLHKSDIKSVNAAVFAQKRS